MTLFDLWRPKDAIFFLIENLQSNTKSILYVLPISIQKLKLTYIIEIKSFRKVYFSGKSMHYFTYSIKVKLKSGQNNFLFLKFYIEKILFCRVVDFISVLELIKGKGNKTNLSLSNRVFELMRNNI